MIEYFSRTFYTADRKPLRQGICEAEVKKALIPITRASNLIDSCAAKLGEFIPCEVNSDCLSGTCMLGRCKVYSLDSDPVGFVKCALTPMSPVVARTVQEFFNVTDTNLNITKIAIAMRNNYYKMQCLDARSRSTIQTSTTQSDCESTLFCNDPSITNLAQCTGAFCGADCSPFDGSCKMQVAFPENVCVTRGVCRTRDINEGYMNFDYTVNATECAAKSNFCTAKACYPNCTRQKCENTGICLEWPFEEGANACFRNYRFDAQNQDTRCGSGEVDLGIGCAVQTANQTTCVGGKYFPYPSTKQACESITVCQDVFDGSYSKRNSSECEKCQGVVEPLFKWAPGRFIAPEFVQDFRYQPRRNLTTNIWIRSADVPAIGQQLSKATYSNTLRSMKSYVACSVEPLATFLQKIACDCGNDSTAGCFPDSDVVAINADLAEARVMTRVKQVIAFAEGGIYLNETSVPATEGNFKLTIQGSDLVIIPSAARQSSNNFVPVVDALNARIGSVVGSGVKLSHIFSSRLCIRRNRNLRIGNNAHTVPAFVTVENGKYKRANVRITANSATEMCGQVADTQFYFPALLATEPTPSRSTPTPPPAPVASTKKVNGAPLAMASVLVTLLCALLTLF